VSAQRGRALVGARGYLSRERTAHVPPPLAEHVERVAEVLPRDCVLPFLLTPAGGLWLMTDISERLQPGRRLGGSHTDRSDRGVRTWTWNLAPRP
jgi:hypothetical protein